MINALRYQVYESSLTVAVIVSWTDYNEKSQEKTKRW